MKVIAGTTQLRIIRAGLLSIALWMLLVLSGGIASGIGYTIWYAALGGLSATQAAVVQLLVPLLLVANQVVVLVAVQKAHVFPMD